MLPLSGIKVVEVAQNLAGPFAGEILAGMDADVVKVERPDGGDDARSWGPPFWRGTSARGREPGGGGEAQRAHQTPSRQSSAEDPRR